MPASTGITSHASLVMGQPREIASIGAFARLATSSSLPFSYHRFEQPQAIGRPVSFTLLEVVTGLRHRVGDVSETKTRVPGRARECVERGGLHLYCQHLFATCRLDR